MSSEQSTVETKVSATCTVGQLVASHPYYATVFERVGIDYCCGGKKTVAEACKQKGISTSELIAQLEKAVPDPSDKSDDWTKASLTNLVEHIIEKYHNPLRTELSRVTQLAHKVAAVHGSNHPEMVQVAAIFDAFRAELELHMQKEELILFPAICSLETGTAPKSFGCGGGIERPIEVMMQEHDSAGDALSKLRSLTRDYTPPADSCNTFKVLLHSLEQIESEMHHHVHKENNILFPRALAKAEKKPTCC